MNAHPASHHDSRAPQLAAALAARARLERLLAAPAPFAQDDGAAVPEVAAVLSDPAVARHERVERIVSALMGGRLIMPVLAHDPQRAAGCGTQEPHTAAAGPGGVLTAGLPDGRCALTVFSSAGALGAWRPDARPVPVPVGAAARTALTHTDGPWLLDPGTADLVVPRTAVTSIARGRVWVPAWRDEELRDRLAARLGAVDGVTSVAFAPGQGTELRVCLGVTTSGRRPEAARALDGCRLIMVEASRAGLIDSVELCPIPDGARG